MINPTLHVDKAFKDQVENYMNNTVGNVTQPSIKNVMTKKNTCVLELIIFYDMRYKKANKHL